MKLVIFLSIAISSVVNASSVDLLSDILPQGKNIEITVSGTTEGGKGMLGFFSKNDDSSWRGVTHFKIGVDNCFSEQAVSELEKNGITLKYRSSDAMLVGYRESVRWLKEQGTQYIFLSNYDVDSKTPKNFKEALEYMMDKTDRDFFETINLTYVGGAIQGRVLPHGCFRSGFEAKDLLFLAGQVTSLALGVSGAKTGNVGMTSLATNTSVATNNTSSIMKKNVQETPGKNAINSFDTKGVKINYNKPDWLRDDNRDVYVETDPKRLSGIRRTAEVDVVGVINKNLYSQEDGFVYSVAEVEQVLNSFKKIPYEVGNIKNK